MLHLDPARFHAAAPVTAAELRDWLEILGRVAGRRRPLPAAALARMLGVDGGTVRRWRAGETHAAPYVRLALHQLEWVLRQHAHRDRREFLLALSRGPAPRTPHGRQGVAQPEEAPSVLQALRRAWWGA